MPLVRDLVTLLLAWQPGSPGPRQRTPLPPQASRSAPLARRLQLFPHKPTGLPRTAAGLPDDENFIVYV
jgi:hypothetical protein